MRPRVTQVQFFPDSNEFLIEVVESPVRFFRLQAWVEMRAQECLLILRVGDYSLPSERSEFFSSAPPDRFD